MVPNRLGDDPLQAGLTDDAVPLRALRPGVEQGPLHMLLDPGQLPGELAAGGAVQLLTDQPGGGDGGLDLMDPLLHILPVLPLSGLGVGYRAGHGPPRPAGQVKELPLIEPPGRREALGEQILLVQAVQDGLQFPEPGSLAEEVGQLHREKDQQKYQN